MKELISVIVPIYKVEQYLTECVESILNQTYRNLEIILVNDGSPDNCGNICEEYRKKDDRVLVIHKENGGLSDARNAGMLKANGSYYFFVDSDDVLKPKAIDYLYFLAQENGADIVMGGFERFDDISKDVFYSTASNEENISVMNKKEAMEDFFINGCHSWGILYRKNIHEDIYFPKGEINEDEAIALQLFNKCSCVVKSNNVIYSYRNRTESITTSDFSNKKLIWTKHCKDNYIWISKNYSELTEHAISRYRDSLLWLISEVALSNDSDMYKNEAVEMVKELRSISDKTKEIPFTYGSDKFKYTCIINFGYGFYRKLIKIIRRIHK